MSSIHELVHELSEQVKTLILCFIDTEMTLSKVNLFTTCSPTNMRIFTKKYIQPAIALGLVELTYPDKPNHPKQKYRLTDLGKAVLQSIKPETH